MVLLDPIILHISDEDDGYWVTNDKFHLRLTAAMKTVLSRRYLELLMGKLVALLLYFPFELIKIDRLRFYYCVFQQRSEVDLFEYDRTHSNILSNELIALFQLHPMAEIARQLYPSSTIYFSERQIKPITHLAHIPHIYLWLVIPLSKPC